MHQSGGNRGIHASRQSADDSRLANGFSDSRDLLLDEGAGSPAWLRLADRKEEVRDYLSAPRSVCHLGMKLHTEDGSLLVSERADRISIALRRDAISLGRLLDVIAVA